jgi:chromosome segregation ATPase
MNKNTEIEQLMPREDFSFEALINNFSDEIRSLKESLLDISNSISKIREDLVEVRVRQDTRLTQVEVKTKEMAARLHNTEGAIAVNSSELSNHKQMIMDAHKKIDKFIEERHESKEIYRKARWGITEKAIGTVVGALLIALIFWSGEQFRSLQIQNKEVNINSTSSFLSQNK